MTAHIPTHNKSRFLTLKLGLRLEPEAAEIAWRQ